MTDVNSLADDPSAPEFGDPDQDAGVAEQPPNAVLIVRVEDDQGIHTEVVTLGDVKATEVATIIELGMRSWRAKIGLS